jgi:hypothetical protein
MKFPPGTFLTMDPATTVWEKAHRLALAVCRATCFSPAAET